jgi:hypothetical protein
MDYFLLIIRQMALISVENNGKRDITSFENSPLAYLQIVTSVYYVIVSFFQLLLPVFFGAHST